MSNQSIVRSSFTTFSGKCLAEIKNNVYFCSQCLNPFQSRGREKSLLHVVPIEAWHYTSDAKSGHG